jgi:hypothetical protein
LLSVGGLFTLVGLISLLVMVIVDRPMISPTVTIATLVPGLVVAGLFLAVQAVAEITKAKDK